LKHLTVRLVWHDRGWDGHICNKPVLNTSCVMHEYVRDNRDDDWEDSNAGRLVSDLDRIPPCGSELGAYSECEFDLEHHDPLDRGFLEPVPEHVPPYSCTARPYGRMLAKDNEDHTWALQEHQLARLDTFFDEIEPGKSLVFFYVDHADDLEVENGEKVVVGVCTLKKKAGQLFYESHRQNGLEYPVWSRMITHSFPDEGVRIPYQEYIVQDKSTSDILVTVPEDVGRGFSYVSETVSDDVALGVLERVFSSIRRVRDDGYVDGAWDKALAWLDGTIGGLWRNRGPCPGVGPVLNYLGFGVGHEYAKELVSKGTPLGQFVAQLPDILNGELAPPDRSHNANWSRASLTWKQLPTARQNLLHLFCILDIKQKQLDCWANPDVRKEIGARATDDEILANPYLLCEQSPAAGDERSIPFGIVDRALYSGDVEVTAAGSLLASGPHEHHRMRAAFVEILRNAGNSEGHTYLLIDDLMARVRKGFSRPGVLIPDLQLLLHNAIFYEQVVAFGGSDSDSIVELRDYLEMNGIVRDRISRLAGSKSIKAELDWAPILKEVLKSKVDEREAAARTEKSEALRKLASNRLSVLVGAAGTGKTKVIGALLVGLKRMEGAQPVLLLAPTGKARVRLEEETSEQAFTIHQFLFSKGWISRDNYALRKAGGEKAEVTTVIIDEASMLPLDLIATLFRAIEWNHVKRLILVGDPNQLPPIGPGKPLVDILAWLRSSEKTKGLVAELRTRSRFESRDSEALELADSYVWDSSDPTDDMMLSRIAKSDTKGDLVVRFWSRKDELEGQIAQCMREELGLRPDENDYESLDKSLGFTTNDPSKLSSWQILCPTRIHYFGTGEMNRLVQLKFRMGLIHGLYGKNRVRPFGSQQIVWHDKVIQTANVTRSAFLDSGGKEYSYIANGEIGGVIFTRRGTSQGGVKKPDSLEVRFSSQKDRRFYYPKNQVDSNLELAYAMTVHKAQGSDFGVVFLIMPKSARTMSREVIYTGLTRFKQKLVLLIEKDIEPLLTYRRPDSSATARRQTNLFGVSLPAASQTGYRPEGLIHRTRSGILVRSKSEVIVADTLSSLGLSYKYEEPLRNPDDREDFMLPDFTVYYEGEVFYWEHLGMLSEEYYRQRWENKKMWYTKHHYAERLITSQDGSKREIDSSQIESIARRRILASP